jgi:hypothetical protein
MIDRWEKRFEIIRNLGWLALASLPFFVLALITSEFLRIFSAVAAVLLILPAFIYIYVIVIWHWKDRYRGKHSDLWGALILIETSGWMKIVYLFRHILPNLRHSGRYRLETHSPGTTQSSNMSPLGK